MLIEKETKYKPTDWVWFWSHSLDEIAHHQISYIQLTVGVNTHPAREDRTFTLCYYMIGGERYIESELFDTKELLEISLKLS